MANNKYFEKFGGVDHVMAKLNPKQQKFADYYIELGNAEQAAIKAGYSKAYARGNAHKLVANSGIKEYIDERLKQINSEKIASQTEILEYLTNVMRGEVEEEVPVPTKNGVVIVDAKAGVKDRTKAAELLGKRFLMWTDKQQIDANIGVTFIDDLDE